MIFLFWSIEPVDGGVFIVPIYNIGCGSRMWQIETIGM